MGAYFGGTRQPLAIAWPKRIKADPVRDRSSITRSTSCRRSTSLTGVTPPRVVNGVEQEPIDGVSMAYAFAIPRRKGAEDPVLRHHGQPRHSITTAGSRACRGPREPWVGGLPKGIKEWSPLTDRWELYNIDED